MVDWLARYSSHQIVGPPAISSLIDVIAQPIVQWSKLTFRKLGLQFAEFGLGCLVKLAGVYIAERIRGKISDQTGTPVNILQNTLSIGGRRYAQIILLFLIPGRWQLRHRQLLVQHILFQFKSDNDV